MRSGKEMLRLLKRHGFEVVRIRGSHSILENEEGRRVVVPVCNTQYPKDTYYGMLKMAGLK